MLEPTEEMAWSAPSTDLAPEPASDEPAPPLANRSVFSTIASRARSVAHLPAIKVLEGGAYVAVTYAELMSRVRAAGTGIMDLGLLPGDRVGLLADNRLEWLLADLGTTGMGAVDIPRGADTPAGELEYILEHSGARFCFVDDEVQLEKLRSVAPRLPSLELAIVLDPRAPVARHGVLEAIPFAEVESRGASLLACGDRRFERAAARVRPDDLLTIIYTSGTTGRPKGVELTHANLLHQFRALPRAVRARDDDRWLSILPPWHVFERAVEYVLLSMGASMAYAKPIRNELLAGLALERPTIMAAVPRVLESIYDGVMKQVRKEGRAKARAFALMLSASTRAWRAEIVLEGRAPDRRAPGLLEETARRARARVELALLSPVRDIARAGPFAKIRAKTGGSLRCIISGGAKLPPHLDEFYHAIGIPILEGYGLTETSPVVAVREPGRSAPFSVGHVLSETEVEIVDESSRPVPRGTPGRVVVRGPQLMRGYHKDREATAAAVSADGRFDTGDLGVLLAGGELVLTGRAKDLIVLPSGEKVEPEAIEGRLKASPLFAHVLVTLQDERHLCALVAPNFEALSERAGRSVERTEAHSDEVRALFRAEIARLLPDRDLKPYERVRRFALVREDFRVGEELTPTLKLKRGAVRARYAEAIAGATT